jgi:ankyrin repeat protein
MKNFKEFNNNDMVIIKDGYTYEEDIFDQRIKKLLLAPNDEEILTLFFQVIINNYTKILKKLIINFNINKFYPDYTGYDKTPLFIAVFHNYNAVDILIKNGADVNMINNYGDTPLISLCGLLTGNEENTDRLKTIEFLIKNNAKLNIQNDKGDTALIAASKNAKSRSNLPINIIELLIKSGASWNINNNEDCDFMDYLYEHQKKIILKKYKEKSAEYIIFKTAKKYNL